ncbi:hypothetical protein C9374_001732 [Naegleria lovaniensis]|uniref:DH domain-containing protein n=1 Tax=Naegleria lovaniensis TaxID=51637 RepID=A0AA88KL23_NAELO|nr:uncharacterized protein C9374_001732 [Naegleria lovaniensis]KAG2387400.1 hypothetical protein C9374_001732 [Naegleria lovaniensis]
MSNEDIELYGQINNDFSDYIGKTQIHKTKGTYVQILKISPQQDSYQVIDLSLATSMSSSDAVTPFDIPTSEVKRLENISDLPSHIQTFIQEKKNKKSSKRLGGLFSKFRSNKSSSSTSSSTQKSDIKSTSSPQLNALLSSSSSNTNNGMGSSLSTAPNTHSNSSSSLGSLSTNSQASQEFKNANQSSSSNNNSTHPPHSSVMVPIMDAAADRTSSGGSGSTSDESEDEFEDGNSEDHDAMLEQESVDQQQQPPIMTTNANTLMETNMNSYQVDDEDIDDREDGVVVEFHSSKIADDKTPPPRTATTTTTTSSSACSSSSCPLLIPCIQAFMMRRKFQEYISKSTDVRNARLRRAALLEILSTEESYYSALSTCKTLFMDPLLNDAQTKKKPILKMEDINEIFGELPSIMQASEMLMSDLRKEIAKWPTSPILIGNIFKSFAPFFRMYSKYINNFDSVSEKVEKLEKSSKTFAQFLAKVHETPECGGLTFTSYLVVPVQRVPRIRLLLQEVLKRTDETHVDYAPIEQALSIVNQVAENLNESKRSSENDKVMFELQEKLRGRFGGILQAHRRYIRTFNSIHVESTKELDKKKLNGFYNAYLFNDMLLLVPQYLDYSMTTMDSQDKKSSSFRRMGGGGGGGGSTSSNHNNNTTTSMNMSNHNNNTTSMNPNFMMESTSVLDEEERFQRLAKESFVIYLAFSKVLDREEKEQDRLNTMMLLTKVASSTPSSHRFNFMLKSFIRTQPLNFIFSFDHMLMRDEMEADITINIEKIDKSMEKKVGQERIDIEKKRMEMCKSIKLADMILSKYLLQKQTGNEKFQQLVEKLSICESELESKLIEYRSLKDEFTKHSESLRDIESKESQSLIDYEEQNQKIYSIDTILWKMLNPDRSAFKEVFGEDPRIDPSDYATSSTYSVAMNSPSGYMASGSIDEYVENNYSPSSSSSSQPHQQHRKTVNFHAATPKRSATVLFNSTANLNFLQSELSSPTLPLKQLKENCNPYIQLAYREARKKMDHNSISTTTSSTFIGGGGAQEDSSISEETETLNALYRIRPLKKTFMIEPFKKLPYKYRIDRILYGENTPQEIMPKFIPYPEEYNDVDMYYNKISDRDGFDSYGLEDQDQDENDSYQNKSYFEQEDSQPTYAKMYDNIYDLPNNVNDLKSMIIQLQMEKEEMKNELNRFQNLKQQSLTTTTITMGMAPLTSGTTTNAAAATSSHDNGIMNQQQQHHHRLTNSLSSVNTPTTEYNSGGELYASEEIEEYVE